MTLTIMDPASVWQQLSNLCFISSGVFNDLLMIRTLLTMAYIFLFITGGLGMPSWPGTTKSGRISVDTMVWAFLNIMLHGFGVLKMLVDERQITLPERDEALWRYVYRHSGLSRAQFQHLILPKLELKTFKAGELIPTKDYFYIIYSGKITAEVSHVTSGIGQTIRMYSGEMFPLEHMYVDYMPQENIFMKSWIKPRAATDVTLYAIPAAHLKALAADPNAREAWMAMLIASLAEIAERPYRRQSLEWKVLEEESAGQIKLERNALFDPLDPSEEPVAHVAGSNYALRNVLKHYLHYMKVSFFVPWPIGAWPVGLRHRMWPPHDPKSPEIMSRLSNWANELPPGTRISGISTSTEPSAGNVEMPKIDGDSPKPTSIPTGSSDEEVVTAHL